MLVLDPTVNALGPKPSLVADDPKKSLSNTQLLKAQPIFQKPILELFLTHIKQLIAFNLVVQSLFNELSVFIFCRASCTQ